MEEQGRGSRGPVEEEWSNGGLVLQWRRTGGAVTPARSTRPRIGPTSETSVLYTMPSRDPRGIMNFHNFCRIWGSQNPSKLMVFHWKPFILKPDLNPASQTDSYTTWVGCLGPPPDCMVYRKGGS